MGPENQNWHKIGKIAGTVVVGAVGVGVIYESIQIAPEVISRLHYMIDLANSTVPNCGCISIAVILCIAGYAALGGFSEKSNPPQRYDTGPYSGGHVSHIADVDYPVENNSSSEES